MNAQAKIRKLSPAIGAELSGIDLNKAVDAATLDEIYAALIEHQVIFFRDQAISPANHLRLAQSFGDIEAPNPLYPHHDSSTDIMILNHGADNPPDTGGWHSDVTYRQNPPFAGLLIARNIPDCGGDTLWLSLSRAWDSLPSGIQSELQELKAVHDLGDFRNSFTLQKNDGTELTRAHQKFGSAVHPMVKTHPVSGRKFIYINESFTQHIVGMRATDSNRLLDFLYRHIDQPENQVRFQWTQGALAIWDNRCTWHYATADYLPQSRVMHRVTVSNDARAS